MRYNRLHLALGFAGLGLAAGLVWIVIVALGGGGQSSYPVTVGFDRAGQLLKTGADVKLRGILVGRVSHISLRKDFGVEFTLAMDPSQRVPSNVSASIRGKTLFGQKFVALTDSPLIAAHGADSSPSTRVLKAGDRIPRSKTVEPFELEQVLSSAAPVLDVVKPGELGGALGALAQGFAGQEDAGRRSIDNGLAALQSLNSSSEDIDRLLAGLAPSTEAFGRAVPALIASLRDLGAFSAAIAADGTNLKATLRDVPSWMTELAQIIERRYPDLVDLSNQGADILDVVARHAPEIPSTIAGLKAFTQAWDTNLSVGCVDASGVTIATAHPELAGSTCWQIWQVSAENDKQPGAYATGACGDQPKPGEPACAAAAGTASASERSNISDRAFISQLKNLLGTPFGTEPSDLTKLLFDPLRDPDNGLLPGGLP